MIIPQKLKPGDAVAIVATARKVNQKELDEAIRLLKSWQLKPVIGSSIGLSDFQFAGTDEERAKDFQNQMNNPEIKAIWCARGGYGTVRILDRLNFKNFREHPKWIIGYSDITVLHAHLNALGIASLHAQMPVQIETKTPESANTIKKALFGEKLNYQWDSHKFNRTGTIKGEIVGGNLSVLYSLCGSASIPDMTHKILFIEDLDEYLYHIDRMMQNLKRNAWFDKISGLLIGGMTAMRDNTKAFGFSEDKPFGYTAKEIIYQLTKDYDFPIAYDFPAGHLKDNRALVLGRPCTLKVNRDHCALQFD